MEITPEMITQFGLMNKISTGRLPAAQDSINGTGVR